MIYTRLGAVRTFHPIADTASIPQLHALRLEFKKLRYTVEFFQEVLGKEAKMVISELKRMQDHLGDLNDADTAVNFLSHFLDEWDAQQEVLPIFERQSPVAVVNYLAARDTERHKLLTTFRSAWENFNRPELHQAIALAVAAL